MSETKEFWRKNKKEVIKTGSGEGGDNIDNIESGSW